MSDKQNFLNALVNVRTYQVNDRQQHLETLAEALGAYQQSGALSQNDLREMGEKYQTLVSETFTPRIQATEAILPRTAQGNDWQQIETDLTALKPYLEPGFYTTIETAKETAMLPFMQEMGTLHAQWQAANQGHIRQQIETAREAVQGADGRETAHNIATGLFNSAGLGIDQSDPTGVGIRKGTAAVVDAGANTLGFVGDLWSGAGASTKGGVIGLVALLALGVPLAKLSDKLTGSFGFLGKFANIFMKPALVLGIPIALFLGSRSAFAGDTAPGAQQGQRSSLNTSFPANPYTAYAGQGTGAPHLPRPGGPGIASVDWQDGSGGTPKRAILLAKDNNSIANDPLWDEVALVEKIDPNTGAKDWVMQVRTDNGQVLTCKTVVGGVHMPDDIGNAKVNELRAAMGNSFFSDIKFEGQAVTHPASGGPATPDPFLIKWNGMTFTADVPQGVNVPDLGVGPGLTR